MCLGESGCRVSCESALVELRAGCLEGTTSKLEEMASTSPSSRFSPAQRRRPYSVDDVKTPAAAMTWSGNRLYLAGDVSGGRLRRRFGGVRVKPRTARCLQYTGRSRRRQVASPNTKWRKEGGDTTSATPRRLGGRLSHLRAMPWSASYPSF